MSPLSRHFGVLCLALALAASAQAKPSTLEADGYARQAPTMIKRDQYSGEARWSQFDGITACGQDHPDTNNNDYAGVPPAYYNQNGGSEVCGKCLTATNDQGTSVKAPIIEKCGDGCGDSNGYGILLSAQAYEKLSPNGSTNDPTFNVDWTVADC